MSIVNNAAIDGSAKQAPQLLPAGLPALATPLNHIHATPELTEVEVIKLCPPLQASSPHSIGSMFEQERLGMMVKKYVILACRDRMYVAVSTMAMAVALPVDWQVAILAAKLCLPAVLNNSAKNKQCVQDAWATGRHSFTSGM